MLPEQKYFCIFMGIPMQWEECIFTLSDVNVHYHQELIERVRIEKEPIAKCSSDMLSVASKEYPFIKCVSAFSDRAWIGIEVSV